MRIEQREDVVIINGLEIGGSIQKMHHMSNSDYL